MPDKTTRPDLENASSHLDQMIADMQARLDVVHQDRVFRAGRILELEKRVCVNERRMRAADERMQWRGEQR